MSDIPVVAAPAIVLAPVAQPLAPGESLPAQTTHQQDLVSLGQRHINVMWERTQQVIAISVAWTVLALCGFLVTRGTPELRLLAFTLLSNVFFLVVGTYFQRTNHTKTGGVGAQQEGR